MKNYIFTLSFILTFCFHVKAQKELKSIPSNYTKKVEFCFKLPKKNGETIKNTNYYINDTLFYTEIFSNNFKIVNGVWYIDDWKNSYTLFYHPDSNNVAKFPYDVKEYNKENIIIYDCVKKIKEICIDNIKVIVFGIYNSSTLDLIQTVYFTPKIGIITYFSSGYGPSFRNDISKVIEYDSKNVKIAEYEFNIRGFYSEKFNIPSECEK